MRTTHADWAAPAYSVSPKPSNPYFRANHKVFRAIDFMAECFSTCLTLGSD